eukprot:11659790-Alexandrium_andersonii.AAC.1
MGCGLTGHRLPPRCKPLAWTTATAFLTMCWHVRRLVGDSCADGPIQVQATGACTEGGYPPNHMTKLPTGLLMRAIQQL